MKKIILSLMLLLILVSCKSKKVVAENKVEVNTSTATEITMAEMIAQGEKLYLNKCGTCHALPKVKEHTTENWKPILLRMQKEAELSDTEREYVYKYIVMQ